MAQTPTPASSQRRLQEGDAGAGAESTTSRRERISPRLEQIGRYILHPEIARGGMASVHTARLVAGEGVSRLVAAKRLHPQFLDEPDFVTMFHDEARIASQIHHPNVVPVLDIVCEGEEVILVQEYVHGVPLSYLFKLALRAQDPIPIGVVVAVMGGVLAGLHAAHEATDELGEALKIVHRDVSPQNVLVSVDGVPRLVDFGIAKAKSNVHHTREGIFKGKLAYMAPEQIRAQPVTCQADVYAAGAMLWELVVNRRFYDGKNDAEFVRAVALGHTPRVTQVLETERTAIDPARWDAISRLEPVVARALSTNMKERYGSAQAMAAELNAAVAPASPADVAAWVCSAGAEYLAKRQQILAENEACHRAQPNGVHVLHRDDDLQGSGARMRALAALDTGSLTLSAPSGLQISGITPRPVVQEQRSVVPWVLVGALLTVVGILAGLMLSRVTSRDAAAPQASSKAGEAPSTPPTATVPSVAPTAADPTTPPLATAPPTHASPPRYVPARVVQAPPPPPRPAPAPAPVPTPMPLAPSARPDCSPPFYFDGTKKVFKPNCL